LRDFLQLSSPYTKCKCKELKDLAAEVIKARQENKKTIVMFGAHLIKTGLSLYLIDLMKRGFVSHLATNGAGAIHDFEIALIGETSEDVSSSIKDGSFGMARETASMMNEAIRESSKGYGQAIGELIKERNLPHKEYSLFSQESHNSPCGGWNRRYPYAPKLRWCLPGKSLLPGLQDLHKLCFQAAKGGGNQHRLSSNSS
jgi:hypothetical protein